MCDKHSFVMDRSGHIFNGGGFIESHSVICEMWKLRQDTVNAYEWVPPADWPSSDWTAGFKRGFLSFKEKSSHVDALERYIRETFPTREAWSGYRNYDLHGHTFGDQGEEIILACRPEPVTVSGTQVVWAYDQAKATLYDQAQATLYGQAQATLYDQAKATLYDQAKATLYDQAKATLYGQAQATLYGQAQATLYGQAKGAPSKAN